MQVFPREIESIANHAANHEFKEAESKVKSLASDLLASIQDGTISNKPVPLHRIRGLVVLLTDPANTVDSSFAVLLAKTTHSYLIALLTLYRASGDILEEGLRNDWDSRLNSLKETCDTFKHGALKFYVESAQSTLKSLPISRSESNRILIDDIKMFFTSLKDRSVLPVIYRGLEAYNSNPDFWHIDVWKLEHYGNLVKIKDLNFNAFIESLDLVPEHFKEGVFIPKKENELRSFDRHIHYFVLETCADLINGVVSKESKEHKLAFDLFRAIARLTARCYDIGNSYENMRFRAIEHIENWIKEAHLKQDCIHFLKDAKKNESKEPIKEKINEILDSIAKAEETKSLNTPKAAQTPSDLPLTLKRERDNPQDGSLPPKKKSAIARGLGPYAGSVGEKE